MFDYDTGNSISEDESESEEEEEVVPEEVIEDIPVAQSPGLGRRSTMNNSLGSAMPLEDSLGMLGSSPFAAGTSPVGRRESSVLANPNLNSGSKVREGAKGRAGPSIGEASVSPRRSPSKRQSNAKEQASAEKKVSSPASLSAVTYEDVGMNDDQYEDATDYAGGDLGVEGEEEFNESGLSSASKRRVSFGHDTKTALDEAPASSSSAVKRRGRPPASAKTPESGASSGRSTPDTSRSAVSTPGSNEYPRGRQIQDETFENSDEEEEVLDRTDAQDSDSDEEKDASGYADDSFASAVRNKNKRKSAYLDDEYEEDDEAYEGTRRSRRATKGKKLAWWKGERAVYDGGRMVGLLTSNPTPVKKGKLMKNGNRKVSKRLMDNSDDEEESTSLGKRETPVVLPTDVLYLSRNVGDELFVWDEVSDKSKSLKIVSYKETHLPSKLPITAPRPAGKTEVGLAAQSFNVPQIDGMMSGWISGYVELPAGAIKDAEGVGDCAQVFFISDCQDNAIELGISDPSEADWNSKTAQRQLLKKGDSFYVPPGNLYRLENHSIDCSCFIFWTIVKPLVQNETAETAEKTSAEVAAHEVVAAE